jgi:hypothetical protein
LQTHSFPTRRSSDLILAPEYLPWRVDMMALIVDVVIWTIVIGVVLFVLTKIKPS